MQKLEFATIRFRASFKDGKILPRTHMEILQDNTKEIESLVPDGTYEWDLTMNIDSAKVYPIEIIAS